MLSSEAFRGSTVESFGEKMIGENKRILLYTFLLLALFIPANFSRKLTGDEPHYLLIAHSIVFDGDIDLRNNYLEKHYAGFYSGDLPDYHVKGGRYGEWYPSHDIGLPLLIALGYWLGGRRLAVLSLFPIALLLAINVFKLSWEISRDKRAAFLSWAIVFTTPPVLLYVFQLFPEIVAALVVVYALRTIRSAPEIGGWTALMVGFGLGYLPWLHMRYTALTAILVFFFLVRSKDPKNWVLFFLPITASAILNMVYYDRLFSQPLFRAGFHEGFDLSVKGALGLVGLLFDAQAGLLIYSPIYILALAGLPSLWRLDRNTFLMVASVFLGSYLVSGFYKTWYAGWCPQPARYLVSVLPLLGIPIAYTYMKAENRWRLFCQSLWALSLVFPLAYLFEPRATYTGVFFWFLKERWAIDLSSLLPTLATKEFWFAKFQATAYWPALLWCVLVGAIAYLLNRQLRAHEQRV